jgi:hypothetical protein
MPLTQGGSPVREIRSPGSVRGAARKGRPYRDGVIFVFGLVAQGGPLLDRAVIASNRAP